MFFLFVGFREEFFGGVALRVRREWNHRSTRVASVREHENERVQPPSAGGRNFRAQRRHLRQIRGQHPRTDGRDHRILGSRHSGTNKTSSISF